MKNLKDVEELLHKGMTTEKAVREARRNAERSQLAVEKASREMRAAERDLQFAREALAAHIKLLEIDLAEAKLNPKQATDDAARATALQKNHAITNEEYERANRAVKQAELQVQRAETRLELDKKEIPGLISPSRRE